MFSTLRLKILQMRLVSFCIIGGASVIFFIFFYKNCNHFSREKKWRCCLSFKGHSNTHLLIQVNHFCPSGWRPSLDWSSPRPSSTSEQRVKGFVPRPARTETNPPHCQETQRAMLCLSGGQCPSDKEEQDQRGHLHQMQSRSCLCCWFTCSCADMFMSWGPVLLCRRLSCSFVFL